MSEHENGNDPKAQTVLEAILDSQFEMDTAVEETRADVAERGEAEVYEETYGTFTDGDVDSALIAVVLLRRAVLAGDPA